MPVIGEVRVNLPAIRRELAEKIALRDRLHEEIHALEATLSTILKYQIARDDSQTNAGVKETVNTAMNAAVFEGKSLAEIALGVMSAAGIPMRAGDIAAKMVTQGYTTDDRAKLKNAIFTSMDRRKDLFTKIESGLWDLRERAAMLDSGLSQ